MYSPLPPPNSPPPPISSHLRHLNSHILYLRYNHHHQNQLDLGSRRCCWWWLLLGVVRGYSTVAKHQKKMRLNFGGTACKRRSGTPSMRAQPEATEALAGSPAHESPPSVSQPKLLGSQLQRIWPPPLAQIINRPSPLAQVPASSLDQPQNDGLARGQQAA
ncbi:unnamed protein product [Fraxinus pennsylvanica]|uniref:Uncharacterized protein n=1 Tax=Fraxinus pennsylvanica TaxID=56036 RepID=A0AAD2A043_9LAMI|nr:unnamed protein product [Fraxinus pennsylvanica]